MDNPFKEDYIARRYFKGKDVDVIPEYMDSTGRDVRTYKGI